MPAKKSAKVFVLDTNVILHDIPAYFNFRNTIFVIPMTVIEEIDHFKRQSGNQLKRARILPTHWILTGDAFVQQRRFPQEKKWAGYPLQFHAD